MNNEIEFCYKFQPLFELLDPNNYPEVDTVIMTGGRGSFKSFTVSCFSLTALVSHEWDTLYTRFTNTSIVDSIKPEVSDKIELLNLEPYVTDTNTHIQTNKARIAFKGIKTGSKQQTANLKSLSGFNCFVVDEAEEIPDYATFKKVFYSIRSQTKRNLTILILNPTVASHWIYEEFFAKKGIEGGSNCVHENVMYIHTSYLDGKREHLAKNIIRDYERMAFDNPTEYENIVLGGWITEPEGVLLPLSQIKFANVRSIPEENIVFKFTVGDPADKGGDHFAMPYMHVCIVDGQLSVFVKDVIHSKDGIESVSARAVEKNREYDIEETYLEVNGVGIAPYLILKKDILNHSQVKPFNSTVAKEVRILSHYEFVKKYFIFDEAYKENPEYKLFLSHVTGYQKEGDNKHKMDAIDVLCSAANILKIKYKNLLYG